MTATLRRRLSPVRSGPSTGRSGTTVFIAVVAAVIVAAVTIGVVLVRNDTPAGADQLAATRHACQQGTDTRTWMTGHAAMMGR